MRGSEEEGGSQREGRGGQRNTFNYKVNVIVISFKPKPKLIRFKMDYKIIIIIITIIATL